MSIEQNVHGYERTNTKWPRRIWGGGGGLGLGVVGRGGCLGLGALQGLDVVIKEKRVTR